MSVSLHAADAGAVNCSVGGVDVVLLEMWKRRRTLGFVLVPFVLWHSPTKLLVWHVKNVQPKLAFGATREAP